ncbi:unnamed protein product [Somion occarium]|uniref:Metallo-dependent hydrolase n=1 Tax=Somion occarium TaxID=3059160 RepID=A0ABP1DZI5_9APHY
MDENSSPSKFLIRRITLPGLERNDDGTRAVYDVLCLNGKVHRIQQSSKFPDTNEPGFSNIDGTLLETAGLLIPGLCHAHIHLDKCFLLDEYSDLKIVSGDFREALAMTAEAKTRFAKDEASILRRGRQLIMQSVQCGVTSMRAHVEIDITTGFACVNAGVRLREEFQQQCDVQIAVFAQDPLYTSDSEQPGENYDLLSLAAALDGVEAIGSAPYVEPNIAMAKENIRLVLDLAWKHTLVADFHLDYNFDSSSEPLIWYLLQELETRMKGGTWKQELHVCVGHATRLALFSREEWAKYKRVVDEHNLPITLVGLPQSDLYMMGRGTDPSPRSTLNVTHLAREHNVRIAMTVNNVQNAFTPQGSVDPLSLCPLGVAVFQSATKADSQVLLESVTNTARRAIGRQQDSRLSKESRPMIVRVGDVADFVLLHNNDSTQSAVLNPSYDRTTIKGGRIVSVRRTILE